MSLFTKAQHEFVTLWKMDSPFITQMTVPYPVNDQQIWIPGIGENFTVQWEEVGYPQHNGTMTNVTSSTQFLVDFGTPLNPNFSDVYYKVKISNGNGVFRKMRFGEIQIDPNTNSEIWRIFGTNYRLMEIQQWGNIAWESMENAFVWCRNLNISATDTPNLSNVTNASYMLGYSNDLVTNNSIANWDTSHIQNFSGMFRTDNFPTATNTFNTNLNSWNVSSATNLSYMFEGRANYNQPLGNWQTNNATNLEGMFMNCSNFNQNLNTWNVGNVTNFSFLFYEASLYNMPLNNWNTSNATTFEGMFQNAKTFNQPIDQWNTANLVSTKSMFMANFGAHQFNQPIGSWNTSNLKTTRMMFINATSFNQPLNTWNTASLEDTWQMFGGASSFNQPLNLWNTSQLKTANFMFMFATSFDQDLGDWNLPNLTGANAIFNNTGMSCENYSKTLRGWANNQNTANNINISPVTNLIYSPMVVADRNLLIGKGWTINGDLQGECMLLGAYESNYSINQIYPNPTSDYIYFTKSDAINNIELYDTTGKLIKSERIKSNKIDISSLPLGVYLLKINFKSNPSETIKVYKQ